MTQDEDKIVRAAEYVLGTLDADERAAAEAEMAVDEGFATLVHGWERRLGELNVMIDEVEPPPEVWIKIQERVAAIEPSSEVRLPEVVVKPEQPEASEPPADEVVVDFPRKLKRWRAYSAAMSGLAAALAIFIAVDAFAPDYLPWNEPAPPPEKPFSPEPGARYVAVMQKNGSSPAFILTVDIEKRVMVVRRVETAAPLGKSYQLWLVSNKFPAPRSLGVIGAGEFTRRTTLADYDPKTINDATFAVSLEPAGGSPTGQPTGPVLVTGKLVEAQPPAIPPPNP